MDNTKEYRQKVLIILFLIVLIIPTLVQITGVEGKMLNSENRVMAKFPTLKLNNPISFLKAFKSYYKDNFGLRNLLASNYLSFKYKTLNESPIPSKVILGKNNFLFLGKSFSNSINESLGFSMFSQTELTQIKSKILERKEWLESKNIAFYIAVAPSKQAVYKEYLPFSFLKKETRKNQLLDYIKSEINFDIIDLGMQFDLKKRKHQIYHKLDSHWNELGSFYACQTLFDKISYNFAIKQKQLSDFEFIIKKESGDLAKMINLTETEDTILLEPLFDDESRLLTTPNFYKNKNISEQRYRNTNNKYKVLLFRDSFGSAMIPYINQVFGKSTYIWSHNFDKELILKEKPDIVIMEYTERYLERLNQ